MGIEDGAVCPAARPAQAIACMRASAEAVPGPGGGVGCPSGIDGVARPGGRAGTALLGGRLDPHSWGAVLAGGRGERADSALNRALVTESVGAVP
mmetsp:Transcript_111322/g.325610  ORF Transcript_111322/g.325610 Transcript_111322/m.325610 type:complete len:95 (+) Transcript_111322:422-706(+)